MNKPRIAIVVSDFNKEITYPMLDEAKKYAENFSIDLTHIVFVPGVFDMPLIIKEILKKKDVEAVVALGAVIKGETAHDRVIANNTARLLSNLSLKYKKPVTLGITGPEMTYEQARARIVPVARHSIYSVLSMINKIKKIRNNRLGNKKIKIID